MSPSPDNAASTNIPAERFKERLVRHLEYDKPVKPSIVWSWKKGSRRGWAAEVRGSGSLCGGCGWPRWEAWEWRCVNPLCTKEFPSTMFSTGTEFRCDVDFPNKFEMERSIGLFFEATEVDPNTGKRQFKRMEVG